MMNSVKRITLFIISLAAIIFVSCIKYYPPVLQSILFGIAMGAFLLFMIYLIVMKTPFSMIITIFLVVIGGFSEIASKLINVYFKQDQSVINILSIISPVSIILGFSIGTYCVVRYGTKRDKTGGMARIVALLIVGCIFLYVVS